MGLLSHGPKGEKFVVSIIDCFSRYRILVPSWDLVAETVSQILYERLVGYSGVAI